jgi:hypothetical protein
MTKDRPLQQPFERTRSDLITEIEQGALDRIHRPFMIDRRRTCVPPIPVVRNTDPAHANE